MQIVHKSVHVTMMKSCLVALVHGQLQVRCSYDGDAWMAVVLSVQVRVFIFLFTAVVCVYCRLKRNCNGGCHGAKMVLRHEHDDALMNWQQGLRWGCYRCVHGDAILQCGEVE